MLSRFRAAALPLIVAPLFLAGCFYQSARFSQTVTSTVPQPATGGLKVTTRNGSISVKRDISRSDVAITATVRTTTEARLGEVAIVADRDASGVLAISATPPRGGWHGSEGCSFEVTTPGADGVDLSSSNGRLTAVGLAGDAHLQTSNGAIHVSEHSGRVEATTSNGRIEAATVDGPIRARTSNGAVTVRVGGPGPVDVGTSNGSVTLELTPAYRGELAVSTSNGAIRLPESFPSSVSVRSMNNGRAASLAVGEGGPRSTIQTSNGGVTVRLVQ